MVTPRQTLGTDTEKEEKRGDVDFGLLNTVLTMTLPEQPKSASPQPGDASLSLSRRNSKSSSAAGGSINSVPVETSWAHLLLQACNPNPAAPILAAVVLVVLVVVVLCVHPST